MAVAAPARRSAPAPAPSRTAPPPKQGAPAKAPSRTSPRRKAAQARPAPSRQAPRGRAVAAPARRAPARTPQRAKPRPKPSRGGGQPSLAIAVGHAAGAVRSLPDTGLVVRMTRGRAWIGVLGVLLVGIVALNVVTLSFAASSGKISEQITTLEEENSVLGGRAAQRESTARIRHEAIPLGLYMPNLEEPKVVEAGPGDVATAAQRLAGAG